MQTDGDFKKIEATAIGVMRSTLDVGSLAVDDDFFLSGGDSFAAVHVAIILETELERGVPLDIVIRQRTAHAVAVELAT